MTTSEIRWSSITMPENEELRINGTVAIDYAPGKAPLSADDNQVRICVTMLNQTLTIDNGNRKVEEYEQLAFIVPTWSERAAVNTTVVRKMRNVTVRSDNGWRVSMTDNNAREDPKQWCQEDYYSLITTPATDVTVSDVYYDKFDDILLVDFSRPFTVGEGVRLAAGDTTYSLYLNTVDFPYTCDVSTCIEYTKESRLPADMVQGNTWGSELQLKVLQGGVKLAATALAAAGALVFNI